MDIRPFRSTDIPALLGWFRTPAELVQWGGTQRAFPLNEAQVEGMLAETGGLQPARRMWAGERQVALAATATALLDWRQGTALLSMVGVAPAFRGQGLAGPFLEQVLERVFQESAFMRLELNVYTFNTAALRAYAALGFVQEGVRRSLAKVGDERWDADHLSMLRHEHLQRTAGQRVAGRGNGTQAGTGAAFA